MFDLGHHGVQSNSEGVIFSTDLSNNIHTIYKPRFAGGKAGWQWWPQSGEKLLIVSSSCRPSTSFIIMQRYLVITSVGTVLSNIPHVSARAGMMGIRVRGL